MSNKLNRGKLQNIYNFQYGKGNTIENIGGDYPIYGSNGIVGYTNKFNSESSPVIGHIGAYAGIVNWAKGKHYVTYNGVICKIKKSADSKFGYYSLLNANVQRFVRGSTQPFVSYDLINEIEIWLPNIETQQKIAAVLCALDNKIELNNQINAELEAMAKTLYDYWFVQFDFPFGSAQGKPFDFAPFDSAQGPVSQNAPEVDERTPLAEQPLPVAERSRTVAERSRGYKSSGGKMVYNELLKREIPEGWEVKKLSECIEKIIDYRGRTPKKLESDWSENKDDILALSAKHVKGGKLVNLDAANRVDGNLYSKWMKEELKEGDILMTSEAPCGEFFYLIGDTKYCLSQRLFAMRANNEVINHSCLYFELSAGNGYSQIMGKVSGSTVFGIRQDELRTVNVLIPAKELQQSFEEKVIPIYQKIRINEKQNQELAQLRDWLLPMMMNGQVTVGDVVEMGMVAEESTNYQKQ